MPIRGAVSWYCLLALGLAFGAALPLQKAPRALGAGPLHALDAYLEGWNSKVPGRWADALVFPHTRHSPTMGRLWQTRQEFVSGIDYDEVLRSGWHHSAWDAKALIHEGESKAHVAGQWSRWDAAGTRILTNQVAYVVARTEQGWGIQARFAAGAPIAGLERDAAEAAALQVVKQYLEAFNRRDPKAWAATLNYPHVRIASGEIRVWESAHEYAAGMDFERFTSQTGWHHSEWDAMRAVQVAADGVNVALEFSRYDAEGRKLGTYPTLYLVTRQEGHWGVRARSSFAP